MAVKWKATMPKEKPNDGSCHIVFAYKTCRGGRLEITKQVDENLAGIILNMLIESDKNSKKES